MTRSAWTTPDQRVCWPSRDFFLVAVVSVNSNVGPAGLVMWGRVVVLDTHQVWMPYVRARVVDLSDVVITMGVHRSGLQSRDFGATGNVDHLSMLRKKRRRC